MGSGKTTGDFYLLAAFLYFYNKSVLLIIREKSISLIIQRQFLYKDNSYITFSRSQVFVNLVNRI